MGSPHSTPASTFDHRLPPLTSLIPVLLYNPHLLHRTRHSLPPLPLHHRRFLLSLLPYARDPPALHILLSLPATDVLTLSRLLYAGLLQAPAPDIPGVTRLYQLFGVDDPIRTAPCSQVPEDETSGRVSVIPTHHGFASPLWLLLRVLYGLRPARELWDVLAGEAGENQLVLPRGLGRMWRRGVVEVTAEDGEGSVDAVRWEVVDRECGEEVCAGVWRVPVAGRAGVSRGLLTLRAELEEVARMAGVVGGWEERMRVEDLEKVEPPGKVDMGKRRREAEEEGVGEVKRRRVAGKGAGIGAEGEGVTPGEAEERAIWWNERKVWRDELEEVGFGLEADGLEDMTQEDWDECISGWSSKDKGSNEESTGEPEKGDGAEKQEGATAERAPGESMDNRWR